MNQQQQNPNPSADIGGLHVPPRQDMEYLCAGERFFVAILWLFKLYTSKIAVPQMKSNPANPFVVENVVIV